jgi:hypothetical protein
MNDDALRAIVREAIARVASRTGEAPVSDAPALLHVTHPSAYQYALPPSDGPCIIEPGVQCNHCGYCQTHGY